MTLKNQLRLLLISPVLLIAATNGIIQFIAGEPLLLVINCLVSLSLILLSLIFIESFHLKLQKKWSRLENELEHLHYTARLLPVEEASGLEENLRQLKEYNQFWAVLYQDQKKLLLQLHRVIARDPHAREYLPLSKELARQCTQTGMNAERIEELSLLTLEEAQKLTREWERVNLVANNIHQRAAGLMNELHPPQNEKLQSDALPLRPGSLRRAIRLAEKRAA